MAAAPGDITTAEWLEWIHTHHRPLSAGDDDPGGAVSVLVLQGKGGVGKTMLLLSIAAEASRLGIPTLLGDLDPRRNLSRRHQIPASREGIGQVLVAGGAGTGSPDPAA